MLVSEALLLKNNKNSFDLFIKSLKTEAIGDSVRVSWSKTSKEPVSYTLLRSKNGDFYEKVVTTSENLTHFCFLEAVDTVGLYFYKVVCKDYSGNVITERREIIRI
jgi:hypothetical protein